MTGTTGGFGLAEEENMPKAWYKRRERDKTEEETYMDERALCPRCRHQNPTENRFCGLCGTSLASGSELAPRRRSNLTVAGRALPAKLKPVGRALAVVVASLAAEACLSRLRRRAEGFERPALPDAPEIEPAPPPERLVVQSLEEVHVWLQRGDLWGRGVERRSVRRLYTAETSDRRG